jgi:sugar transferase (PEP-CTERM system associated)
MSKGLIGGASGRLTTLVLLETVLILGAIAAAANIRLGSTEVWRLVEEESALLKALLIVFVCQLCLHYSDLYDDLRITRDRRELLVRIFQALGATSILLSLLYYLFPALILGRGIVMIAAAFISILVVGWRILFSWFAKQVGPRQRLLLVGTSAAGVALAKELHLREDMGIEIVGFVDSDISRVGEPVFNPGVIGTIDDIPELVRTLEIDRVVVSLADARGKLPMAKLLEMRMAGVTFHHMASVYEEYTGKISIENLRPSWLIFSSGFRKSMWREAVKRGIDVVAAVLSLLLLSPVLILLAALVRLTSPGPAVYRQQRVGLQGRLFNVYKLRSMRSDAEAESGAVWSRPGDARVTPLGRFMRRTRLDELPQMWNVIKGDMSLVGPRPERPEFVHDLATQIPFYGQRHVVKPGITGWAQVRYTYGATVEDAMEKLQYDLFYIKNFTISLDLFIIFETLKTVVLRKGV